MNISNNNIDFNKNNIFYQEIKCGLGNQLFILFNLISLSTTYKYIYIIHFDDNYNDRKNFKQYSFFKNIKNSKKLNDSELMFFEKYNEKNHYFKKINPNNKNLFIKGYFQSYKYFWKNINAIKNHLYIDQKLISNIRLYFSKFKKKILSIHIRLGDYLIHPKSFPITPISYFKKALSFYNLKNYQIILFSDNLDLASEILKPLNIKYIYSSDYSCCDETQLYMLMLSDVKICSNSTYSLMSCYLNEIYNFVNDAEYIFPSIWFNKKKINYKIDDLMINNKFVVLDLDKLNIINYFDVITPIHEKDLNNYKKYLSTNTKFLNNASYYYISSKNLEINNTKFINENLFPFTKEIIRKYLNKYIPKNRVGWYYQQLLKLYIFKINIKLKDYILILDADIIFLKQFLIYDDKPILYYLNLINDKQIHIPYQESISYLFPEIKINKKQSGVCHHMLFNRIILNDLLNKIEKKFNKPAWKAICDSVIEYVKKFNYNISIFSEYELYFCFIKNYYKDKYEYKNINFLDINLNKFNWIDKQNYAFIGNHSWRK